MGAEIAEGESCYKEGLTAHSARFALRKTRVSPSASGLSHPGNDTVASPVSLARTATNSVAFAGDSSMIRQHASMRQCLTVMVTAALLLSSPIAEGQPNQALQYDGQNDHSWVADSASEKSSLI